MTNLKENFSFICWLFAFSILLIVTVTALTAEGFFAVSLLLSIVTLVVAIRLVLIYSDSNKRLKRVLKSLANDDPTLGLLSSDPLVKEFGQVRQRISQSRTEIEVQHQFLTALLVHLDSGILVLSENNQFLRKNPALDRLLGLLPKDIEDEAWGQLGLFIKESDADNRCIIPWQIGAHSDTLLVRMSCSSIQGNRLKIINVQSIYQALQAKEQQAYKQLTRVLTHEIANSIMPLASLAQTCKALLPDSTQFEDGEDKEDLDEALDTIARRASHLDKFIKRFAETTQLPPPDLQRIEVRALVERVLSLHKQVFTEQLVEVKLEAAAIEYWLMADAGQLEQLAVNLIKNSLEAMKSTAEKCLYVSLFHNPKTQLIIEIQDSGPGIEPHVIDQVFIPFFTTKPEGSGIGLSLSKQIMVNHGGDLVYVKSADKSGRLKGACFQIVFG